MGHIVTIVDRVIAMPLAAATEQVLDLGDWTTKEFAGNELWRFGLLLLIILTTMIVGRIAKFVLNRLNRRFAQKERTRLIGLFLDSLAGPASVAIFAGGMYASRLCMRFAIDGQTEGLSKNVNDMWVKLSSAVAAIAVAYLLFKLVDIVEFYLRRLTGKTETSLDDMLVPLVRKSLRLFIVVVAALFIADNVLGQDIKTILAAAGVGGLAIALAARETIENFFGSINIFADRPFQVGERIRVGSFDGPVEEVGFRSTRIRTLDGHQVSVPNSKIVNDMVENIGRRPFIKRVANITITYDTPPEKVERAVEIIKGILALIKEINTDPELPPRVYFSDFNDWSLNILVLYWFKPPEYWRFQEINQQVNLAIMRAFEKEQIEFAFPTQTLYLKKTADVTTSN